MPADDPSANDPKTKPPDAQEQKPTREQLNEQARDLARDLSHGPSFGRGLSR